MDAFLDSLKYDDNGLLTAVVVDADTNDVLMVAYMNREAVKRTLTEGRTCFWSRSRQKFWVKGETSGHVQKVREVRIDCDRDCLVVKVEQTGAACHDGYRSCFYRTVSPAGETAIADERLVDPDEVYKK